MKIGVLFCAYRVIDTIKDSLASWIELKHLGEHSIDIAAVSLPFTTFFPKEDDGTQAYLLSLKHELCWIEASNESVGDEADTRRLAAEQLRARGCELIILWDGDEIASAKELSKLIRFIQLNKFINWFNFSYKNLVFTDKQYLAEPFTPPRAFRILANGFTLGKNFGHNMFVFHDEKGNTVGPYQVPHTTIPKSVAWIRHFSWIDNARTYEKIAYQTSTYPDGCPFVLDETGRMKWNEFYFLTRGERIPIVEKQQS